MPGYRILKPEEGTGLRPWEWGRDRLDRARTYWVATARPDGRPHAMAVWGQWLDDRFWFSSDLRSRKARNLMVRPEMVFAFSMDDFVGSATRWRFEPET